MVSRRAEGLRLCLRILGEDEGEDERCFRFGVDMITSRGLRRRAEIYDDPERRLKLKYCKITRQYNYCGSHTGSQ